MSAAFDQPGENCRACGAAGKKPNLTLARRLRYFPTHIWGSHRLSTREVFSMTPARFKSTTFVSVNVTKWLRLLCVGLGIALFSLPASAQLNYGRIYGAITDQSGGAVAGATVTVIDVDRGIPRTLVADDTGDYSASSLLPGNYSVRAEFKGFKAAEHTGLTVAVGQDVRVDLSLQPGEQTQTV